MFRDSCAALVVVAFASLAMGEDKPKQDKLWIPDRNFQYAVVRVLNDKEVLVEGWGVVAPMKNLPPGSARPPAGAGIGKTQFIWAARSTTGLKAGESLDIARFVFKVTGNRIVGGSSLDVMQRDEKAEKEREEQEAASRKRIADAEAAEAKLRADNAARARKAEEEKAAKFAAEKPMRDEKDAQTLLELAKKNSDAEAKKKALLSLVSQYPKTKAAEEARKLLK
jgi:hypothetical protein